MIPVMIIPVLNQYDLLRNMISTIDYPINHMIIIDNGGKLDSLSSNYINELSIIRMPSNLGIATSYNLGIKLTPMEKYWVFAQDDMEWVPGGLEIIDMLSAPEAFLFGFDDDRPFCCRSVGEDVVKKVGLLDESYYPAPGDDINYHKRCHFYKIKEIDITGTYISKNSTTIRNMMENNSMSAKHWASEQTRSLMSDPVDEGWSLSRRRSQEHHADKKLSFNDRLLTKNIIMSINSKYTVHSDIENRIFGEI